MAQVSVKPGLTVVSTVPRSNAALTTKTAVSACASIGRPTPQRTRVQYFSIDPCTQGRDHNLFQERMAELFSVPVVLGSPKENDLKIDVTAYCGRHLRFATLYCPQHSAFLARQRSTTSWLMVTLLKKGTATFRQDGRECRVEADDLVIIDPARQFTIETGEAMLHSVFLQRDVMRELLPEIEILTARAIPCREGPGSLFRAISDEMLGLLNQLTEETASRIADALPYVLCPALTSCDPTSEVPPSKLKFWHKRRILRFAREHLADHKMDATAIARAVNLSTRYVYEIFEGEGQPLMKWIWSQRLERCRSDLSSPALVTRAIGDIAFSWGFNDRAHFSRAFRQRYGCPPREFRCQP